MITRQSEFRVNDKAPNGLKLRGEPESTGKNILGIIAWAQKVTKLEDSVAGWWKIQTTLNGLSAIGFVRNEYLSPADETATRNQEQRVSAVHLPTAGLSVTRNNGLRAYPLTEVVHFERHQIDSAAERVTVLRRLIEWLKVESSLRYLPIGRTTFCNIYVYDYCNMAGAYLPHVWWTHQSIHRLKAGQPVLIGPDVPVEELCSNALNSWFTQWGAHFGWRRTFDLTELQDAANEGKVCITVARSKPEFHEGHGHIVAVVPETGSFKALRHNGNVLETVQSQAGYHNYKYIVRCWWEDGTYAECSHWIHD